MPDLIIKPKNQSGNKFILQDQAGGAVLTTADSGVALTNINSIAGTSTSLKACGFSAYMTADQADISEDNASGASSYSVIQFNGTLFDTHSGFNTSTYKYTIPTGQAGIWAFNVGVMIYKTDSVLRGYQCSLFNGSTLIEEDAQRYAGNDIALARPKISAVTSCNAGDVIEVRMQTNTTTNDKPTAYTDFYSAGNSHMNNNADRGSIFNGYKIGHL